MVEISKRVEHWLAYVFLAPSLGHGRAVELFLTWAALNYGLILLFPHAAFLSPVTLDIAWEGYGQYLAFPLLLKAFLSGVGLLCNINGIKGARLLRFSGALVGSLIWATLFAKFFAIGLFGIGLSFCLPAALFSVRIMAMALAGLPRPAAPGSL